MRVWTVEEALDPKFSGAKPLSVAMIDEGRCIGCTLCIQACPVDAIVGAAKLMHTVITRDCTGCELCLAPCPVDCITMLFIDVQPTLGERQAMADRARQHCERRQAREMADECVERGAKQREVVPRTSVKNEVVLRAIERAQERLAQRKK